MTSAIVLCGGRSTRMGRDKASLPFGEKTLLDRVVRLVGDSVEEVVIVGRPGQFVGGGSPFLGSPVPVSVVCDPTEGLGPLAAIVTGLQAITGDRAFVTACDMPLLRPAMVRRLLELLGDHEVCVPVLDHQVMPLCAVYRTSVVDEAERLLAEGKRSVMGLIDRVNAKRVDAASLRDIDPDLLSCFSCDTPEAYQRALQMGALKRYRPPWKVL